MQQQNVINTTNAITTYCFKFHPPFLSPEALSVCRFSLSIVNLLAVPLLSAASAPAVHVLSAFHAYGKRAGSSAPQCTSEIASHFRTRGRSPYQLFLRLRQKVRKTYGFPDPLARSHASDPSAAASICIRFDACSLLPMRTLYPMQGGFPIAILYYLPLI